MFRTFILAFEEFCPANGACDARSGTWRRTSPSAPKLAKTHRTVFATGAHRTGSQEFLILIVGTAMHRVKADVALQRRLVQRAQLFVNED